jgi:probable HAF family extracellular repeat protein
MMLACSYPAFSQGTYTQIDYPGATTTSCYGIDSSGDVTGFYIDSAGSYHGFLLSRNTYTTIDYPGAQATTLFRINDVGQIVGVADYVSFVYDENNRSFTEIAYPGAVNTVATSINNAGTVAGYLTWNDVFSQGFEFSGSSYQLLTPRKSENIYIWGVTGSGELVGNTGNLDFSFDHGGYRQITIPGNPVLYGVNEAGSAFVGDGFFYRNNTLQTLRFPGGGLTLAYAVNNAGRVVGLFLDSNYKQHCFSWTARAGAPTR